MINNGQSQPTLSTKNVLGLGAVGGTIALLWSKIVSLFDLMLSVFIEQLYVPYPLDVASYLKDNSYFSFRWKSDLIQRSMYLKKWKTRRTCYFVTKTRGIFIGKKWWGICSLHGDTLYFFRWSKFFQKHSEFIYKDIMSLDHEEFRNNFYIKHVCGSQNTHSDRDSSRDLGDTAKSASAGDDYDSERSFVRKVKSGMIEPLYLSKEDFDFENELRDNIFSDYYLSDNLKSIVTSSKKWIQHEKWFKERNITWKRGICLYGEPGCGKSSFVLRLCKFLGIPLYVYSLPTLSNSEFIHKWNSMNKPSIALFEDFDSVFDMRKNVSDVGNFQNKLTFDTVLNAIDGTNSCDGIITIVTTNHIDKLDTALLRSGRIDDIIEVKTVDEGGKLFIAKKILNGHGNLCEELLKTTDEKESNADFENRCIKKALEYFWNN